MLLRRSRAPCWFWEDELNPVLLYVRVVFESVTGQPPVVTSAPLSTEIACTRWGLLPVATKSLRDVGSMTGVPRIPSPPVMRWAVQTVRPVVSSNATTLGLGTSVAANAKNRPAFAARAVALHPVAPAGQPALAGPASR